MNPQNFKKLSLYNILFFPCIVAVGFCCIFIFQIPFTWIDVIAYNIVWILGALIIYEPNQRGGLQDWKLMIALSSAIIFTGFSLGGISVDIISLEFFPLPTVIALNIVTALFWEFTVHFGESNYPPEIKPEKKVSDLLNPKFYECEICGIHLDCRHRYVEHLLAHLREEEILETPKFYPKITNSHEVPSLFWMNDEKLDSNSICNVCGMRISDSEEIIHCPFCNAITHKTHLLEWIKIKGSCPICHAHLNSIEIYTWIKWRVDFFNILNFK